jgi:hypothetical protein
MYYTEKEMSEALQRASRTIDLLTVACTSYTRGINDCFALLAEYDLELRGESKARDIVTEPWKSTKDWCLKLARKGYSVETYAEYCGYEIVKNKRPKLGDIAFYEGGMINSGDFWVSTNEDNTGMCKKLTTSFFERRIPLIARPIRS